MTPRRWRVVAGLLGLALLVGCGVESPPPGSDAVDGPAAAGTVSTHGLLARGIAHAEIEQWAEARNLFEEASQRSDAPPEALYDLAVAHYRLGDLATAGQTLDDLLQDAVARDALAHRPHLLRARLAYETGDAAGELAALEQARQQSPEEPAVLHALAELAERSRAAEAGPNLPDLGTALTDAWRSWPENSRLAAAQATWALGSASSDVREEGFERLSTLVGDLAPLVPQGAEQLEALLTQGRAELATSAGGAVPVPLRRALNLLRSSHRFRADAAALEARLQVVPRLPTRQPEEGSEPAIAFAPEIAFEPALDSGLWPSIPNLGTPQAMVRIDDAVPPPDDAVREAGIAVLGTSGLAWLPRLGDWQTLDTSALNAATAGRDLLRGDFDDDGRPELVVLGDGLEIWGRGQGADFEAWPPVELPTELRTPLTGGLVIDFEHDGDLDLLVLDAAGRPWWIVHRGQAGLGDAVEAPILVPTELAGPWTHMTAVDLDGDDDQDLISVVESAPGESTVVWWRNWQHGAFSPHQWVEIEGEVRALAAAELSGDPRFDLALLMSDGTLGRIRGLDLDRWSTVEVLAGPWSQPPRSVETDDAKGSLAATDLDLADLDLADLDLDGDLDLLLADRQGLRVAWQRDAGRFEVAFLDDAAASAALALDLDGDRDGDVVALGTATDRAASAWFAQGAEDQQWIELALRAPERKVPRDGHGTRVSVTHGSRTTHLQPGRANTIVGLGKGSPSLVTATWPNGITEYLFEPNPRSRQEIALSLRVEGSCPFLYAHDGEELRFVTDILGLAPLGMLASRDRFVPADPEEYLRLPDWTRPDGDRLPLRITEELREVTYLDQVELVVVEAPNEVEIYNGERWLPGPVDGLELRLLGPLRSPDRVLDHGGDDVTEVVRQRDGRYLTNHRGPRRYQGAVDPHHLVLELDRAALGPLAEADLALVLVGWLHWGNTSTNVARSQDPQGAPIFPRLEIAEADGSWRPTGIDVGLPAGKTKPVVATLGKLLAETDTPTIRLRLTTDFEVYWDQVALAEHHPEEGTSHQVHRLPPTRAELSFGGFARWTRDSPNGPWEFDLAERRAYPWRTDPAGDEIALAWREHEGWYSTYGEWSEHLLDADDRLVVFGSGDQLDLDFDLATLPPLPEGWKRVYFLHSEGWEKDGDPNVACGRSVEPLPRRGQVGDPCGSLDDADLDRRDEHHRWVASDRLLRRVAGARALAP